VGTFLAQDYQFLKDLAPCNYADDGGDDGNLTLLTPCWYVSPVILSGDILYMSDVKE
jgi:hypothetical protein